MSPQSQHLPKGAPSPPEPPRPHLPMGHNTDMACSFWSKIFPPSFSPDTGQNLPWGEGGGDHLPTAGGMLPMLLRMPAMPECGSSSTLASRVATPSSWALMTPTRLPRTRRGSPGAKGTGAAALGQRHWGHSPVGKRGALLSPLNNLCVKKISLSGGKGSQSKAGSVPTWLQAQPQTPHGMLQARPHASHTPTCTNTPPNPALYQPPRFCPQPQAFICFSAAAPGSKAPAATQGTHRAPGASSALPAGLAFCSPRGSGRGCACTLSRTPGKWEFNHGQQMQEG